MGNRARALALATWFGTLASAVMATSGAAFAQSAAADAPAKASETKTTVTTVVTTVPAAPVAPAPPAPASGSGSGSGSSESNAAATPAPASNVMGSTYSDHPQTNITDSPRPSRRAAAPARAGTRSAVRAKAAVPADAPIATFPGFEMLPDGGTRVFVQVSKNVAVEERHGSSSLTYVLKGAHVLKRNNTNPLVTIHMNTPVASARLVPSGSDVDFVVTLRASSTPTWKVAQSGDGASRLEIDFPKGTFVNAAAEATPIAKGDPGDRIPADGDSAMQSDEGPSAGRASAPSATPKRKQARLTAAPPKSKP